MKQPCVEMAMTNREGCENEHWSFVKVRERINEGRVRVS